MDEKIEAGRLFSTVICRWAHNARHHDGALRDASSRLRTAKFKSTDCSLAVVPRRTRLQISTVGAMNKSYLAFVIFVLILGRQVSAQNPDSTPEQKSTPVTKGIDYLLNYLNMAGTLKASDFRPLTQRERTHLYFKTMVNPLSYIKAGWLVSGYF